MNFETSTETAKHAVEPDHNQSLISEIQLQQSTRVARDSKVQTGQGAGAVETPPANGQTDAKADGTKQLDAKTCAPSPTYNSFIDSVASLTYEPERLGNIAELKNKFNCEISNTADAIKFANKAIMPLLDDPYSYVMSKESLRDLRQATSGRFGGIGAEITTAKLTPDGKPIEDPEHLMPDQDPGPEPPKLTKEQEEQAEKEAEQKEKDELALPQEQRNYATVVYKAIAGSPAALAKLQHNDVIAQIDGESVLNKSMDETRGKLLGDPGSKIHLQLLRDGKPIERDLVRAEIKAPTVEPVKIDKDGFAYIKINSFGEHTADELEEQMRASAKAKGFIVDVRNNPGGLVETSLESTEMFIKEGKLMSERSREDSSPDNPVYSNFDHYLAPDKRFVIQTRTDRPKQYHQEDDPDRHPYLANGRPTIVLTNRLTASGAEIFTGALHDTADATTLGTKSFGKGVGQTVMFEVADGAGVKVTSLRYQTPSGKWPGDAHNNRIGLDADVEVPGVKGMKFGSPEDVQYKAAQRLMKEKLDAANHK